MASRSARRSRALDSNDEDSRPNTPSSTAPNDSKRIRRNVNLDFDDGDDSPAEETSRQATTALSVRKSQMTAGASNGNVERQSGHQPGAIVRVKLTNFVTYTSAEFFPGPNLNMVIGPNGTGKSTLVCAICLGLGWPPKLSCSLYLGRAREPAEFVKHGCREATIEIELQRKSSTRKNPVITRVIKREGNQSTYFCNGKQSSGREVQHLANSFNVQIDNLCQFLPQDKVVEFAQMSPIELLVSTQRAVAGPEMIRHHENLKTLRTNQNEVMKEDKSARELLANLENRQAMQEAEVGRMRERALAKKRLERLEQSRVMLRYQEAKKIAEEAKDQSKAISQDLKHLKASSAPALVKVQSKKEYQAKAQTVKTRCETELIASVQACEESTKAIAKSEDEMKGWETQIQAEKTGATKNKQAITREQGRLLELKRKKAEAPENFDVTGLTNEIQDLRLRVNAFDGQKTELDARKTELRDQGLKVKQNIEGLNARLETFGSQANQQEEKLKNISRHTWTAWEWIQNHQDEFSQHVYGPPLVECSLKDSAMADAIESFLQQSDFKFITVQNKADFTLLQRKLFRDMKLHDVSLRECNTTSLDQFRPPVTQAEMQRFGLSGYALDYLQGPTTVLAQLCYEKNLHRCAISSKELSQQQHDELAKTDIQSYAAGKKIYQFLRRREYGAAGTSARVQDVHRAKCWTDQPVDLGRKAALQRELNEARGEGAILQSEYNELKEQLRQLAAQKTQIMEEMDTKKREKEAKQRARMEYNALDFKIQTTEDAINTLRLSVNGVRARISEIQEEFDAALIARTEAVLQFASAARDVRLKTASLLKAEIVLIEAVSDHKVAEAQNNDVTQAINQKEAEQTAARELYRQQHELARSVRDEALQVYDEGERMAREGDNSFAELLAHVARELKTQENLEAEIDAEKAKLELTEGGNANIIAEFERRAKDIGELQAKVRDTNKRQAEFRHGIETVRKEWEPRLEEFVAKINDAFSDSFARIGCAGQVAVHKASSDNPADCTEENGGMENGLDFANWAIHISVKFREQEPLSLLDSHRQSGGERAVSTIFYLMALQSLSRAPFRVVDEINQGMDPRNERMVHGRMVDIAADDGGSQYFLITPKLLSGLRYTRGMTVLCIVSGENVPAARERDEDGNWQDGPKVDFRVFVQKAKDLGIGVSTSAKRIDSGVGIGRSFENASQSTAVGA